VLRATARKLPLPLDDAAAMRAALNDQSKLKDVTYGPHAEASLLIERRRLEDVISQAAPGGRAELTPWSRVFLDRPINEQPAAPGTKNAGYGIYLFGYREKCRPDIVYPLRIGKTAAATGGFRSRFYRFLYDSGPQHKRYLAELEHLGLELCYCFADVRADVEAKAQETAVTPETYVDRMESALLSIINFAANCAKNGRARRLKLPAVATAMIAEARRINKNIPSQKALRGALMVD
jgi:hypothetical protein